MDAKTWLCRGDLERARLLDMSRRLRGRFRAGVVLIALAVLSGVPTFGWGPLVPCAVSAAVFAGINVRMERWRRPEYAAALNWLISQLAITAALMLAHGPRIYLLALYVFPTMLISVLFPARIVVKATLGSVALMIAAAFAAAPDLVLDRPPVVIYPVVCLLCTAIWASAARAADSASRDTAVVDRLTGLLNRAALAPRVAELRHQERQAGDQVAVIACDIDHFKHVNDTCGHATGDQVLQEVAYRLRKELGAFNSAYRIGGEEFVVLLTGADADAATALAERMRQAVSAAPISGCPVTMSFGIAASQVGQVFDYGAVFALADGALYEAKRSGRDRVIVAGEVTALGDRRRNDLDAGAEPPPATPRGSRGTPRDRDPAPRSTESRRAHPSAAAEQNWLIVDDVERAHMLDVHSRLDTAGHLGNGLILAALLLAGPFYGWWGLPIAIVTGALFQVLEGSLSKLRRPEYALGVGWVLSSAAYAAVFFPSHGYPAEALTMLILMNVGFSAVFPARGVIVGGVLQALFMVVAAVFAVGGPVLEHPALLAVPLALLGAITAIGTGVGQSAVEHRGAAVVDQLTGLLNRAALDARVAEITHQVSLTGQAVALIIGDLDHFKSVNDRFGHAAGDTALRAMADVLRANVRAFDSIYRFGGEEIAILLPGMDEDEAAEMAERLRAAVSAEPLGGMALSMSFGVTATAPDTPCDFPSLFARADSALYEAKRAGRDRVRTLPAEVPAAETVAA